MNHALWLALVLALFWLGLSGHYTPLLLAFGVASIALVGWLAHRMDILDSEAQPLRPSLAAPRYWLWLAGQILISAVSVAKCVWTPRLPIDPAVAEMKAEGLSPLQQATYANSITLTPGTLALAIRRGSIAVHALNRRDLEELRKGAIVAQVRKLEVN